MKLSWKKKESEGKRIKGTWDSSFFFEMIEHIFPTGKRGSEEKDWHPPIFQRFPLSVLRPDPSSSSCHSLLVPPPLSIPLDRCATTTNGAAPPLTPIPLDPPCVSQRGLSLSPSLRERVPSALLQTGAYRPTEALSLSPARKVVLRWLRSHRVRQGAVARPRPSGEATYINMVLTDEPGKNCGFAEKKVFIQGFASFRDSLIFFASF